MLGEEYALKIMQLLIMQFSSLGPNIILSTLLSNTLRKQTVFYTHGKDQLKL
jgi:hypothetical protein